MCDNSCTVKGSGRGLLGGIRAAELDLFVVFLASLSEPEAESGQLCLDPPGQAGVEPSHEQEPATERAEAECHPVSEQQPEQQLRLDNHLNQGRTG